MDIVGFIGGHVASAVVGAVGGFVIWKMAAIVWEYFKPIEQVSEYCESRAYSFGLKTREFLIKRVADPEFRDARLKEIIESSEEIQDAFVKGIKGELF